MKATPKQKYDRERYLRIKAEREAARPPDPISLLDETTVAYIAGLTDADGSIHCSHTDNHRTYYPRVVWAMTHKPTVVWLAETLRGGAMTKHNYTSLRRGTASWGKAKFRVQWATQIAGSRAQLLCRRMRPYMRTKAEQSDVVAGFPCDARLGPGVKLSEEIQRERRELARRVSELNRW